MKPVIIDSEAERELIGSVEFYERRRAGLGLEFEAAARIAVHAIQAAPNGTHCEVARRADWSWIASPLSFTTWICQIEFGSSLLLTPADIRIIGSSG